MWSLELFSRAKLGEVLDGSRLWTKEELLDYVERVGAPRAAIDLIADLEEGEMYECVTDIWQDMPTYDWEFGDYMD